MPCNGGCYPSMHCRWYPSMPCSRGCAIPACLAAGRVPAPGGVGGRGVPGLGGSALGGLLQGGCLVETPRTATAAGGTHPTAMHSCVISFCKNTDVSS